MYCIDGSDNRFPPLYGDNAPFSSGYDCLHPNCRHHLVPYFEDKESPNDFEKMRKESNKPFKDNRTSAEVKQYQRGQARNRQVYEKIQRNIQDEAEYATMVRVIGKDNMPHDIDSFKKLKYNNPEEYHFYQLDKMRRLELEKHPEKALPEAKSATIAESKCTEYLFAGKYKDGLIKGELIKDRLGYDISNYEEFMAEIKKNAPYYPTRYKCKKGDSQWCSRFSG